DFHVTGVQTCALPISVMQPYIFPYIGYFQLINTVDVFVFYDDVNFIKKGWINRNNVLHGDKSTRFTIPLRKVSQNKPIFNIDTKIGRASCRERVKNKL